MPNLRTNSLSVPYIPPAKEYVSLETLVERFPNWGYQLYFQEKSTNAKVERQVTLPTSNFLRIEVAHASWAPALSFLQVNIPRSESTLR